MRRFGNEPLVEVWDWLEPLLVRTPPGGVVTLVAPDPDLGEGLHAGERIDLAGVPVRHRSLGCWSDLAEVLGARLLVPRPAGEGWIRLRFERLDPTDSFHGDRDIPAEERYGAGSRFGRVDKLEEPSFVSALTAAYRRVDLPAGAKVLDLGVGTGAELELLERVYGRERFAGLSCLGVDHSESALALARERLRAFNCRFLSADLNDLQSLGLGRFDLVIGVGVLQSTSLRDGRGLFQTLVKEALTERGAVILGLPNCRYASGEAVYGAWTRNHNHPELSLVLKDVDFYRRYLEQHRFRVTVTGKLTLFVTATRLKHRHIE